MQFIYVQGNKPGGNDPLNADFEGLTEYLYTHHTHIRKINTVLLQLQDNKGCSQV